MPYGIDFAKGMTSQEATATADPGFVPSKPLSWEMAFTFGDSSKQHRFVGDLKGREIERTPILGFVWILLCSFLSQKTA